MITSRQFSAVADVEEWRSDWVNLFRGSKRLFSSSDKLIHKNTFSEVIEVLVRELRKRLTIYTSKVSILAPEFINDSLFIRFIGNKLSYVETWTTTG